MKHTQKGIQDLILLIRLYYCLFVGTGNSTLDREERQKAVNRYENTVYKLTESQKEYLMERFEDLYQMLLDKYSEQCSAFEYYSHNRHATHNVIFSTFIGLFYGMEVHAEYDLKYQGNVDVMLIHADSMNLPYDALLMCFEHHRKTVKGLLFNKKYAEQNDFTIRPISQI